MKKFKIISYIILILISITSYSQNTPKYSIEKQEKDSKGITSRIHVYIPKKSNIKQVNTELFKKYNVPGISSLQIYYYDDKSISRIYSHKIFDKNISEKEVNRMGKHLIGKFEFIPKNNNKSFYIGENADLH